MKRLGIVCFIPNENYVWDENSEFNDPIGGSEIWAINIANELAKKGYDVFVFGNPEKNHISDIGVKYVKILEFKDYERTINFDFLIFSRSIELLDYEIRCKNIYLMLHDTTIVGIDSGNSTLIKKIAYQSDYQKYKIQKKYNIPDDLFFKTFEAIHQELYDGINNCDKKNKMLFSQGYGRGSRWFVEHVYPLIKKEVPDFELNLCSYNSKYDDLIFKQEGINNLGSIDKKRLAIEQCESKIFIYPNHGYDTGLGDNPETFSITLLENAYAKCACILGKWGSFSSTLEGYDGFIGEGLYENIYDAMPYENLDEFARQIADEAIKCLKDEEYRKKRVESSYEIAKHYTWDKAAETFEKEMNFMITEKDLSIYILALKNYPYIQADGNIRKCLQLGKALTDEKIFDITDDTGDNISEKNRYFSETTGVYWIWKNGLNSKYVGHEHHRRHYNLSDEEIVKILENEDIILPNIVDLGETIESHYHRLHIPQDLTICERVVKDLYPEYSSDYDRIIKNGTKLYCGDSYITTKENYSKINEFIFSILFEIERRYGFKNADDWRRHAIESGQKSFPKDHEKNGLKPEDYQMLIMGFLYERLLTLYAIRNFEKIHEATLLLIDEIFEANNMKTMLCCIGRMENDYIREYVEYYKYVVGVTNICLYDNNRDGEDDFNDVIGDYIKSGFVILKNYRNIKEPCQLRAYKECYEEYKNDYDWFLFFDIDEFLTFSERRNLPIYLSMKYFKPYDMIHVNWLLFGDDGEVASNGKPVLQRIVHPLDFNLMTTYNFPDNFHVKSIVRGGLDSIEWKTPHTPIIKGRCCTSTGEDTNGNSLFTPYDYRMCALLHFTTKTASEFADKVNRGFCDGNSISKKGMIEQFFQRNEVIQEKVDIFKNKTGIDVSYLLPYKGDKNDEVKIYTLCYEKKNFKFLDDAVITPLQVGASNGTDVCKLKDNTGENISDKNYFYVECTGTYWIWKNVQAKYKGQMQYRRPLSGVCDTMNFDKIFDKYDVITCEPFYHPDHKEPTKEEPMFIPADTVEGGYAFSNCVDDISLLEMVIKMYYPDYSEDYDKYIKNGGNLYYSNGFIMKGEDFDRYSEFLFGCLEKYLSFANINNKEELIEHVKYNLEVGKYIRYEGRGYSDSDLNWQIKIGGFLSERIWTLWLQHNFSDERIYKLPYIKMESNMYT